MTIMRVVDVMCGNKGGGVGWAYWFEVVTYGGYGKSVNWLLWEQRWMFIGLG